MADKPATPLMKVLKAPFYHDGIPGMGFVHDQNTRLIDSPGMNANVEEPGDHVAKIRGWGFFQNYANGEDLQDNFKQFTVDALNFYYQHLQEHPEQQAKYN